MRQYEEALAAPRWWHIVLPVLFVTLVGMFQLAYRAEGAWPAPNGWQLIVVLTANAALLLRYRRPLLVAWVTVVLGAVLPMITPHVVLVDAASVLALYTMATRADRRTAWTTALAAAVLLTSSAVLWLPGHLLDIRVVFPANYVVIAVAVGDAVRNQRALLFQTRERAREAEHTREGEARRRVIDERVRIARDLHDVVAHHITLVNAQAGVAHHLAQTHPDKAREVLAEIKETSRAALDELRATVGLLRQDDEHGQSRQPVPGIDRVEALVESFRAAGFDVRLTRRGAARPPTGAADLAAYRIVQEAMTNAGKHGAERRVDVELNYTVDAVELVVTNPAQHDHRGVGTGYGLVGMRERAETANGSFAARMRPDGLYEVRAVLPLRGPAGGVGPRLT
ncbi:histidine kinase [Nocardiopsis dassonvillei]|uniref:sensor histidine kinase n=1 Tax=Nocardiopsis dassonvillei TaxID=2014 RepID=UPI00200CAE99|nr:histidine kinase [Nocardiopsis dassonvillei]MCK9873475.1 histidine kinase [Nocardiopsis dassonvillei]